MLLLLNRQYGMSNSRIQLHYRSLLVEGMPKLLSNVSSLCHSGGLYTSIAGVNISTRVDIDESLLVRKRKESNRINIYCLACE